jgi:hypothetical protein
MLNIFVKLQNLLCLGLHKINIVNDCNELDFVNRDLNIL